jgi:uncharacterized integral membrane protein
VSEDPTRATPRHPRHGSVGPVDPHADPATNPNMRPVGPSTGPIEIQHERPTERIPEYHDDEPPTQPVPSTPPGGQEATTEPVTAGHTRTGGLYVGLVLSAIVLIFLLIFILQNLDPVRVEFLSIGGNLPIGVAMLASAVAGLLLVAIPGGLRILQLRRAVKKAGAVKRAGRR